MAASAAGFLAVALVAATPSSPFLPIQPQGAEPGGPFRWLAGVARLDRLEGPALVAAGVAAVALAAAGFALAAREAWRGRLSVRTVLLLAGVYHLVVLTLPLLFSRDVYSYAMYGRMAGVHGANPYVAVPADFPGDPAFGLVGPRWIETPAVYGPLFTLLSAGMARAIGSLQGLVVAFRTLAICASFATAVAAVALARRVRPERAAFAGAVLGLNPVVLFQSAGSGHNDLLVALGIAGAALALVGGRELLAAALLALSAVVKAPAAVPLLLLVVGAVARRPREERLPAVARLVGVAGGIGLAAALPFLQARDPTLGMLELATHEGWLAPSRFFRRVLGAAAGAAGGEGVEAAVALGIRLAFAGLLLAALAALARRVAREAPEAPALLASWAWGLLLLMLLGPVLLPWYVTWALPLACLPPRVPRAALLGTSLALTVSQFTAEPARFPAGYDANLLFGHYVVTPVVVVLLALLLLDLRRRVGSGAPLEDAPEELARDDHGG